MDPTLVYLFDPLCGWCYGAAGPLTQILETTRIQLRLIPTGLFCGDGARAMSDEFAAYAWSNDKRIERLTGQVFSERYHVDVLCDRRQAFDSGPSTMALTAVNLTTPDREFDALKAIQSARYVDGLDVTKLGNLTDVLAKIGLKAAVERMANPDDELLRANRSRVTQGTTALRHVGAQGVPAFVLQSTHGTPRLLDGSALFSDPQTFARELNEAV